MKRKKSNKKRVDLSMVLNIIFISTFFLIFFLFSKIINQGDFKPIFSAPKEINNEQSKVLEKNNDIQTPVYETVANPTKLDEIPFKKINFKYTYTINVQGTVTDFVFKLPLPYNDAEKQYVVQSSFSLNPSRVYKELGNTFAEFDFKELKEETIQLEYRGVVITRLYDLKTAKKFNANPDKEVNLNRYLKPERLIESNDSMIVDLAKSFKGNSQEEIVNNIYEFVNKKIGYTIINHDIGAKKALLQRRGKCTEFSTLMVALCRARGIPARVVSGHNVDKIGTPHAWVEVYYDDYGWVSYDPTQRPINKRYLDSNGNIKKIESIIDSSIIYKNHIALGINIYTPYLVQYLIENPSKDKVFVTSNIKLSEN